MRFVVITKKRNAVPVSYLDLRFIMKQLMLFANQEMACSEAEVVTAMR